MFKSLPPTCHSKSISINYSLQITVEMEDVKCSEIMIFSKPLIIIPATHAESYGYYEPNKWNPRDLASLEIKLTHFPYF